MRGKNNTVAGPEHHMWKGGRFLNHGYVKILKKDHPNATAAGYVREHILVAEAALGKYLPPGAVVHHVNEKKDDNRPENLVICQDASYHCLLHARKRALDACGNANFMKCQHCKQYDDPENLYIAPNRTVVWHQSCRNSYQRARYAKKMGRKVRRWTRKADVPGA